MSDESRRVDWVLNWISRMVKRYGGTIYDRNGKILDWGQALCRECYGEDWIKIMDKQNISCPSWQDIERAKKWEDGEIPEWVLESEK